ncbi:MAG: VOC family protein [Telmatospirillum sp.]|nr:VOC family protein [Telmatospirillum sp.]
MNQRPDRGQLVLDHVAHWVPAPAAAAADLAALGFCVTPFSAQSVGDPPVPAGTGNHCVMLEGGYLEFLAPLADTPNAATLRAGIARYTGVHLIAFGTVDPAGDHARLQAGGFGPLEPVALSRPIETPDGFRQARFTVVRTKPGAMEEGRVQFVEQHTPDYLWQRQWLSHKNGATRLKRVEICVADPQAAALRYAAYTGLATTRIDDALGLATSRGAFVFRDPVAMERRLGVAPPCLPWIAGYALAALPGAQARRAVLPASLGGVLLFEPDAN